MTDEDSGRDEPEGQDSLQDEFTSVSNMSLAEMSLVGFASYATFMQGFEGITNMLAMCGAPSQLGFVTGLLIAGVAALGVGRAVYDGMTLRAGDGGGDPEASETPAEVPTVRAPEPGT